MGILKQRKIGAHELDHSTQGVQTISNLPSRLIYRAPRANRYFLICYLRQRVKTVAYVSFISGKNKDARKMMTYGVMVGVFKISRAGVITDLFHIIMFVYYITYNVRIWNNWQGIRLV